MFKLITNKLLSFLGIKHQEPSVPPKKNSGGYTPNKKSAPPRPPQKFNGTIERPEESAAKKRRRPRKKAAAQVTAREAAPAPSVNSPYQARPTLPKPEQLIIPPEVEGKVRFCDLNLHEDIKYAIQEMKFEYCTEIQTMALPIVLSGQDIAAKAQTGTGKTAAFLLAIFNNLLNNPKSDRRPGQCRALVMAPTRELAIQIYKDAESIARFTNLHNVVVFGGMDHEKQRTQLSKPIDILIGTPGRIIDFSRSGKLLLNQVETLVIDEADRM
ncbi:MAG: DEAD/DEAH box helicase, partial [Victivallaceae bacterium]